LTRLYDLEGRYARLEAEHARCQEVRAARERDGEVAGHLSSPKDLAKAVRKLSKPERVRILGVMAEGQASPLLHNKS
jgi:hypothetical protein